MTIYVLFVSDMDFIYYNMLQYNAFLHILFNVFDCDIIVNEKCGTCIVMLLKANCDNIDIDKLVEPFKHSECNIITYARGNIDEIYIVPNGGNTCVTIVILRCGNYDTQNV